MPGSGAGAASPKPDEQPAKKAPGEDGALAWKRFSTRALSVRVRFKQVAAGLSHAILLDTRGFVWVAGCGPQGQLGLGESVRHSPQMQPVPGLLNVVAAQVAAGDAHSMVLDTSGCVWAFGDNTFGQLGIPPATKPTDTAVDDAWRVRTKKVIPSEGVSPTDDDLRTVATERAERFAQFVASDTINPADRQLTWPTLVTRYRWRQWPVRFTTNAAAEQLAKTAAILDGVVSNVVESSTITAALQQIEAAEARDLIVASASSATSPSSASASAAASLLSSPQTSDAVADGMAAAVLAAATGGRRGSMVGFGNGSLATRRRASLHDAGVAAPGAAGSASVALVPLPHPSDSIVAASASGDAPVSAPSSRPTSAANTVAAVGALAKAGKPVFQRTASDRMLVMSNAAVRRLSQAPASDSSRHHALDGGILEGDGPGSCASTAGRPSSGGGMDADVIGIEDAPDDDDNDDDDHGVGAGAPRSASAGADASGVDYMAGALGAAAAAEERLQASALAAATSDAPSGLELPHITAFDFVNVADDCTLGLPRIASIACGGRHTIMLTADGCALACGDNSSGQLGVLLTPLDDAMDMTVCECTTCSKLVEEQEATRPPLRLITSCIVGLPIKRPPAGAAASRGVSAGSGRSMGADGAAGAASRPTTGASTGTAAGMPPPAIADFLIASHIAPEPAYVPSTEIDAYRRRLHHHAPHFTSAFCGSSHSGLVAANGAVFTCGRGEEFQLGHGVQQSVATFKLVQSLWKPPPGQYEIDLEARRGVDWRRFSRMRSIARVVSGSGGRFHTQFVVEVDAEEDGDGDGDRRPPTDGPVAGGGIAVDGASVAASSRPVTEQSRPADSRIGSPAADSTVAPDSALPMDAHAAPPTAASGAADLSPPPSRQDGAAIDAQPRATSAGAASAADSLGDHAEGHDDGSGNDADEEEDDDDFDEYEFADDDGGGSGLHRVPSRARSSRRHAARSHRKTTIATLICGTDNSGSVGLPSLEPVAAMLSASNVDAHASNADETVVVYAARLPTPMPLAFQAHFDHEGAGGSDDLALQPTASGFLPPANSVVSAAHGTASFLLDKAQGIAYGWGFVTSSRRYAVPALSDGASTWMADVGHFDSIDPRKISPFAELHAQLHRRIATADMLAFDDAFPRFPLPYVYDRVINAKLEQRFARAITEAERTSDSVATTGTAGSRPEPRRARRRSQILTTEGKSVFGQVVEPWWLDMSAESELRRILPELVPLKPDVRHYFSDAEVLELHRAFEQMDVDGSGTLEANEIQEAMQVLGVPTTIPTVVKLIELVDDNGSGTLEFHEYLELVYKVRMRDFTKADADALELSRAEHTAKDGDDDGDWRSPRDDDGRSPRDDDDDDRDRDDDGRTADDDDEDRDSDGAGDALDELRSVDAPAADAELTDDLLAIAEAFSSTAPSGNEIANSTIRIIAAHCKALVISDLCLEAKRVFYEVLEDCIEDSVLQDREMREMAAEMKVDAEYALKAGTGGKAKPTDGTAGAAGSDAERIGSLAVVPAASAPAFDIGDASVVRAAAEWAAARQRMTGLPLKGLGSALSKVGVQHAHHQLQAVFRRLGKWHGPPNRPTLQRRLVDVQEFCKYIALLLDRRARQEQAAKARWKLQAKGPAGTDAGGATGGAASAGPLLTMPTVSATGIATGIVDAAGNIAGGATAVFSAATFRPPPRVTVQHTSFFVTCFRDFCKRMDVEILNGSALDIRLRIVSAQSFVAGIIADTKTLQRVSRYEVAKTLATRPSLVSNLRKGEVDLGNCGLRDIHAAPLVAALRSAPIVAVLNLRGNRITDAGCESLVQLLRFQNSVAQSWDGAGGALKLPPMQHFEKKRANNNGFLAAALDFAAADDDEECFTESEEELVESDADDEKDGDQSDGDGRTHGMTSAGGTRDGAAAGGAEDDPLLEAVNAMESVSADARTYVPEWMLAVRPDRMPKRLEAMLRKKPWMARQVQKLRDRIAGYDASNTKNAQPAAPLAIAAAGAASGATAEAGSSGADPAGGAGVSRSKSAHHGHHRHHNKLPKSKLQLPLHDKLVCANPLCDRVDFRDEWRPMGARGIFAKFENETGEATVCTRCGAVWIHPVHFLTKLLVADDIAPGRIIAIAKYNLQTDTRRSSAYTLLDALRAGEGVTMEEIIKQHEERTEHHVVAFENALRYGKLAFARYLLRSMAGSKVQERFEHRIATTCNDLNLYGGAVLALVTRDYFTFTGGLLSYYTLMGLNEMRNSSRLDFAKARLPFDYPGLVASISDSSIRAMENVADRVVGVGWKVEAQAMRTCQKLIMQMHDDLQRYYDAAADHTRVSMCAASCTGQLFALTTRAGETAVLGPWPNCTEGSVLGTDLKAADIGQAQYVSTAICPTKEITDPWKLQPHGHLAYFLDADHQNVEEDPATAALLAYSSVDTRPDTAATFATGDHATPLAICAPAPFLDLLTVVSRSRVFCLGDCAITRVRISDASAAEARDDAAMSAASASPRVIAHELAIDPEAAPPVVYVRLMRGCQAQQWLELLERIAAKQRKAVLDEAPEEPLPDERTETKRTTSFASKATAAGAASGDGAADDDADDDDRDDGSYGGSRTRSFRSQFSRTDLRASSRSRHTRDSDEDDDDVDEDEDESRLSSRGTVTSAYSDADSRRASDDDDDDDRSDVDDDGDRSRSASTRTRSTNASRWTSRSSRRLGGDDYSDSEEGADDDDRTLRTRDDRTSTSRGSGRSLSEYDSGRSYSRHSSRRTSDASPPHLDDEEDEQRSQGSRTRDDASDGSDVSDSRGLPSRQSDSRSRTRSPDRRSVGTSVTVDYDDDDGSDGSADDRTRTGSGTRSRTRTRTAATRTRTAASLDSLPSQRSDDDDDDDGYSRSSPTRTSPSRTAATSPTSASYDPSPTRSMTTTRSAMDDSRRWSDDDGDDGSATYSRTRTGDSAWTPTDTADRTLIAGTEGEASDLHSRTDTDATAGAVSVLSERSALDDAPDSRPGTGATTPQSRRAGRKGSRPRLRVDKDRTATATSGITKTRPSTSRSAALSDVAEPDDIMLGVVVGSSTIAAAVAAAAAQSARSASSEPAAEPAAATTRKKRVRWLLDPPAYRMETAMQRAKALGGEAAAAFGSPKRPQLAGKSAIAEIVFHSHRNAPGATIRYVCVIFALPHKHAVRSMLGSTFRGAGTDARLALPAIQVFCDTMASVPFAQIPAQALAVACMAAVQGVRRQGSDHGFGSGTRQSKAPPTWAEYGCLADFVAAQLDTAGCVVAASAPLTITDVQRHAIATSSAFTARLNVEFCAGMTLLAVGFL